MLAQFPEFEWLAVADRQGWISAQAGKLNLATGRPKLDSSSKAVALPLVTDRRARVSPGGAGNGAPRVVDLVVRMPNESAGSGEVLYTALSWNWVDGLLDKMRNALDRETPTQVILVAADGEILAGPAA